MRILSVTLVTGAAIAAAAGARTAAFYLLLASVPAVFAAGLALFGDFVDGESRDEDVDLLRAALHALTVAFVLVAAATPRLAIASCFAALGALALAAVLHGAAALRAER